MKIMDSLLEAKLNKFSSNVMNDAQKKLEELEAEIKSEKASKLESKYDEFLEDAYERIQDCISKIRKEDNERVRMAEFDAKKALLKKREEIIDDVFGEASRKLYEFKGSPEYGEWLKKRLKKAVLEAGEGKKQAYLTEADCAAVSGELPEGVAVEAVPEKEFWGGVRVRNLEKGIMVDYSFYELLQAQRADFLQNSGLVID